MRVSVLFASALLCSSLGACSTKKKLDNVLDNADKTITNANKRINELSDLAEQLQSDLSDAAKETSSAAADTLHSIGDAAGGIPATGGQAKGSEETADLDDDGKPDTVTAVEYDDKILWLVDSTVFASEFKECVPQMYLVTDKPPETLLSWGLISETCGGAMACPPEELDKKEPDFNNCTCTDAKEKAIGCMDYLESLAGGERVACDDGKQTILASAVCDGSKDCKDGSDEADEYCNPGSGGTGGEQQAACQNGTETIAVSQLCDGTADCSDGSDEDAAYCEPVACDNGELIPTGFVCDGAPDCQDSSDEAYCG